MEQVAKYALENYSGNMDFRRDKNTCCTKIKGDYYALATMLTI